MGKRTHGRGTMALLPLAVALGACTGVVEGAQKHQTPPGLGNNGSGGSAGAGGGGAVGTASCDDDGMGVSIPKRLVRLSFLQLANGIESLLGAEARTAVDATKVVPSASDRDFQPLFNEGPQVSSAVLPKTMQMAEAAAGTVKTGFGCAEADDACTQQALLKLAGQAYRRPVTADEQASLTQLYTELKALGNSSSEAASLATQGILLAAPTLYRTELGGALNVDGRLAPFEMASLVSYFVADAPPDAALLEAAASGKLDSDDGVRTEIARLLQGDAVRKNLQAAVAAYFELGNVLADAKDPALYPDYTQGLKLSMLHESELFLQETLWQGQLGDLLKSRRAMVNTVLAPIYGVTYPGPATDLEDVFLPVDLPAGQRAGLPTRAAILAMRSRPDETSVVSRGLFVNATVLCAQHPPEPPASVLGDVGKQLADKTLTQKQKAESRATTSPCSGCHMFFDPYGLTLESFDAIGRFRTNYASFPGMPAIDTTTQLPEVAGGAQVKDVFEMLDVVTSNGRFSQCMAANLTRHALAEDALLDSEDCGVAKTNERFRATDQSFASLLAEVAVSPITTTRVAQ